MRSTGLIIGMIAAVFVSGLAWGQEPRIAAPTPTPSALPPQAVASTQGAAALTAQDVSTWLDGFMPYALQTGDIAGAEVVVVKGGAVLVSKGYGYADVARRTPVDPEHHLFRPGSVSKLFTWTAVMQQVERGRIDLDADVNTYLDFRIPPRAGSRPVTMRDIMTHTAGFEESAKDLIVPASDRSPDFERYLKRWVPARIFPAGETPAYSNYATTLAGYIVQRVSGVPFDEYMDRNLFQPLGMTRSSFRQPLPPGLARWASNGYDQASKPPGPYEFVAAAPAGSLAAPAGDMAAFMIAHLQNGEYRGRRILAARTAQLMHTSARTLLPPLNRMVLGFYETNINGHRVIGHGGDTQYFHSYLHLFLDDGVGLYVSMNSTGKAGAAAGVRAALFEQFADRYFPAADPTAAVDAATARRHARMIAGRYDNSRRMETSFLSLANLAGEARVTSRPDGTIAVSALRGLNGRPKLFRETSPFVWRDTAGKDRLAARVENGRITRFSVDEISPFMAYEPTPAYRSGAWLAPAAGVAFLILALTALAWPVTVLVRRKYGATLSLSGAEAAAYRAVRIGAAASATALALWAALVVATLSMRSLATSGSDGIVYALHVLGTAALLFGLFAAGWNLWAVWRGQRGWWSRLWSVLLVLASTVVVWLAVAFHLIGLSANY